MKISEIYYFPYPGSLHRRWRFWRCWMRNLALDVSCHPHKAKMFYFLQTGKSWCTTSVCISSDFHQPASNSTIFIMTDRLNHHICKMETHTELVSSECGLGCTVFQWTQLHCTIIATKKHCLNLQTCRFLHIHEDCMTRMQSLQITNLLLHFKSKI